MKKIFLIILLMICVVGCSNNNAKDEELSKLKAALINNGFLEEDNNFKKIITEEYDDNGKVFILKVDYFDINNLSVSEVFTDMDKTGTSMNNEYSFRTDIGTGDLVFYSIYGDWENNRYDYSYDFKNGNLNCVAMVGSCTDNSLANLKSRWLSFMTNNKIDIELLK